STEIKVSQRKYDAVAEPSSNLPHIRIDYGNNAVHFGTEQNRHVNVVRTDETSVFFAGTYYAGDHTLKFGVDYAEHDIFNYYGSNQNYFYRFGSLKAYIDDNPREFAYREPLPGCSNVYNPAAFTLNNTCLFIQDT